MSSSQGIRNIGVQALQPNQSFGSGPGSLSSGFSNQPFMSQSSFQPPQQFQAPFASASSVAPTRESLSFAPATLPTLPTASFQAPTFQIPATQTFQVPTTFTPATPVAPGTPFAQPSSLAPVARTVQPFQPAQSFQIVQPADVAQAGGAQIRDIKIQEPAGFSAGSAQNAFQSSGSFAPAQFANNFNVVVRKPISPDLERLQNIPFVLPFLRERSLVPHLIFLLKARGEEGLRAAVMRADAADPMSIVRNDPEYKKHEITLKMEREQVRNLPDVVKSDHFQCSNPSCGSRRMYITQAQLRSADEGMSTLLKCANCGQQARKD